MIVSYKMPVNELKTVRDYKEMLTESMFLHALNQRFFKLSRRKDPPYFSCSATADDLIRPLKAYIMSSSCKERGTLKALESMLIEVCNLNTWRSLVPPPFNWLLMHFYIRLQGYDYMGFQIGKYLWLGLY